MASRTPIIQDTVLTYQENEQVMRLMVDTSEWYRWLSGASIFAFRDEQGTFTARKERAGNKRGGEYWKAYRRSNGKLRRAYLGKSEELTLTRLQEAARDLASQGRNSGGADATELVPGAVPLQNCEEPQNSRQGILPTAAPRVIEPNTPRELLPSTKLHRPRPRSQLVSRSHLTER